MKYFLYFAVLLFSSINLSSAADSTINGHLDRLDFDTYKIDIFDAPNFQVDMTSDLDEASIWLFDAPAGDLVLNDQFWSDGFSSVFPGDLGVGDEGMYYLAVSIFGVEPTLSLNIHDGWLTDIANPFDTGDYSIEITGATVPVPPVLWLLSAGLLVMLRERKKLS